MCVKINCSKPVISSTAEVGSELVVCVVEEPFLTSGCGLLRRNESRGALRNTGWVGFQGEHPFDIVSRRQVVLDGCTTFSQRGFDHSGLMRLNQILRPRAVMRHVYYLFLKSTLYRLSRNKFTTSRYRPSKEGCYRLPVPAL